MGEVRRRPYAQRLAPDARREQLLDATIQIIARDGYAGISIDAIAREAGVTRPVVYRAFDGLEPLLYALLDRQESRALSQLMAVLEPQPGRAEALTTLRRLMEIVAGDPLTWGPILAMPEGTPAAVRERIESDKELVRGRIAKLIEEWLHTGGPRGLDAEVTAHSVVALLEYFGRVLLEDPERFGLDRLVANVEVVLGALSSQRTP
jgi:AcrR family transcriptional regulator